MQHSSTVPLSAESSGGSAVRSFFVQKTAGRPGLTYEPVQKLGEGAFGVAHLVRDKRTSQLRVLKTINKRQSQVPPAQMEREIANLKACDHPHIIRLFEYYEDYENIYLIMERAAGGELHQVLLEQRTKGKHLPERWVCVVTRQCLQAISYVHSMGIIHKDLKTENIMLLHVSDANDSSVQPHIVIIDLGIAELFAARLGRRARCTVVAGTPTHMAPEVWRGNFGPVADVWSLGVVLFELLSGELPFFCSSLNSAAEWVRLHRQGPNWSLLTDSSAQARAINQRMLSCDERMRPTAQQCLGHSWFKEESADIERLASAEITSSAEVPQGATPRSIGTIENLGDRLKATFETYQGRSKFEKNVLLQVASQLHTAQIGRIGDIFAAADTNRNGTLDKAELLTILRKLGADVADAEAYVACLDIDENGTVEYTEFAAGCIGLLYESLRGLLWQSFCVLDVDGNGVLGRDEVTAVVTRTELQQYGFPGGGAAVNEVLSHMDVDKNGQISFDELCQHFLPPRPSLPSPSSNSPRTTKGEASSADVLFSAPSTAAPLSKEVATLKDEDFAQLLDEIEADRDALTAPREESGIVKPHTEVAGSANDVRRSSSSFPTPVDVYDVSDRFGFGASSTEPFSEMPLSLEVEPEDPFLHASAPIVETPVYRPSAAEVDEELENLLADIADDP